MPQQKGKVQKSFSISYDMKDTEDHSIDAEVLGLSLLNLSRTIKRSQKIVNGNDSEIEVNVQAHKEGSFTVELMAWYTNGGKDILDILGLTVAGSTATTATVLGAISAIKSKKITASVTKGDKTTIMLDGGDEVECPPLVAKIVLDHDVRQDLSKVICDPISGKVDAKFVIKDENGNILETLESEKASSFRVLPRTTLQEVAEVTEEQTITFTQVNFDTSNGSGWRCTLPNGENHPVKMKDSVFLSRINNGYENFSKGVPYIVKLATKTTIKSNSEPTVSYSIPLVVRKK
ncbi:hypothetical protein [Vibrio furnissii]|uniref:hypothetical protein n=1 Tax=Vibrio furnissii TaxID=29494 RepID=UPI0015594BB8|nr:hypothetical protein [Vibrio furnissii]